MLDVRCQFFHEFVKIAARLGCTFHFALCQHALGDRAHLELHVPGVRARNLVVQLVARLLQCRQDVVDAHVQHLQVLDKRTERADVQHAADAPPHRALALRVARESGLWDDAHVRAADAAAANAPFHHPGHRLREEVDDVHAAPRVTLEIFDHPHDLPLAPRSREDVHRRHELLLRDLDRRVRAVDQDFQRAPLPRVPDGHPRAAELRAPLLPLLSRQRVKDVRDDRQKARGGFQVLRLDDAVVRTYRRQRILRELRRALPQRSDLQRQVLGHLGQRIRRHGARGFTHITECIAGAHNQGGNVKRGFHFVFPSSLPRNCAIGSASTLSCRAPARSRATATSSDGSCSRRACIPPGSSPSRHDPPPSSPRTSPSPSPPCAPARAASRRRC